VDERERLEGRHAQVIFRKNINEPDEMFIFEIKIFECVENSVFVKIKS
jgi:hypothetical protein